MKNFYEVRFHLGSGKNYRKWQIKHYFGKNRTVSYLDPTKYQLELTNCTLVNKINKSRKVHQKMVKDVCGWIKCDMVVYFKKIQSVDNLERIFFNPIVDPHWKREGDNEAWDGAKFTSLLTVDRKVYILEESGSIL